MPDVLMVLITVAFFRPLVCHGQVVRPDMNVADILELILAVAMLVYLGYVLIRPERF